MRRVPKIPALEDKDKFSFEERYVRTEEGGGKKDPKTLIVSRAGA